MTNTDEAAWQQGFGKRLKRLREHRNYSQREVAEAVLPSGRVATVTAWEKGTATPSGFTLTAIVELFEADGHWLLTGMGKPLSNSARMDPLVRDALQRLLAQDGNS